MLLENKVAFVTGASRGIGNSIARIFAQQGATVYANARMQGSLAEFAKEMESQYSSRIIPLYYDVTDSCAAKEAIMRIKKEQEKLDVLVNNAGIMKNAVLGMISEQMLEDTYNTNVFAVVNLTQLVAKLMMRQKSGSIVNISSIAGEHGSSGQAAYASSKGAIIALTKSAAKELAGYNIRVNAIAPGIIDTELHQSASETAAKVVIGMNRLGTPEDVANACVFFASDLSSYVTGQTLVVSGGTII